MADHSLHSSTNPHFFQPLLPGFHTHLNIPVAFFSNHVERRNDQNKTAKLRSDASNKTWTVKMDGLKFTDGWEEFAVAHDLRIGDITVFRHEGEMVFHVTAFGPSCCEIQYASSHKTDNDEQINIVTGREKRKRVTKKPSEIRDSSSDHSRFVANLSPSSLRFDRLYVPLSFARPNSLHKMGGKKIVLLDEEGRSWNLNLQCSKAGMHTFVTPGWRKFCAANGMKRGHYTFKLVRKSEPPVIRLCHAEHRPKSDPKSSLRQSCYVGSVTPYSLKVDKLYLRRKFVTANGLDKGCSEIVLTNEWGRWPLALKHYESSNHTSIGPGWKTFCQVNGIKAGDSFMFKLVGTGKRSVLSFYHSKRHKTPIECPEDSDDINSLSSNTSSGDYSRKSQEREKESLGDKSISQECFEMEKRKYCSRSRASSSYSQDQFVKLTLTPHAVRNSKLILPLGFIRVNGINKLGKITLLGKDGVKQVVDLLQNKRFGIMRNRKGWRGFCEAHGLKIGESFVLELIWEEEASPVLKFCNNVNSV